MTRLEIDREMQVEVATDPELRLSVYPHNTLTGALNPKRGEGGDLQGLASKLLPRRRAPVLWGQPYLDSWNNSYASYQPVRSAL